MDWGAAWATVATRATNTGSMGNTGNMAILAKLATLATLATLPTNPLFTPGLEWQPIVRIPHKPIIHPRDELDDGLDDDLQQFSDDGLADGVDDDF